tara:strand:- start:160 stop:768 length:609 start_codon:yes stop_codon:yes gene_type:complete
MKRLLLPLLAALALPTAVNANWLSGDIVETNAVGEKKIVKKGTIRLEKNTVNDRYEEYKYTLKIYEDSVIDAQEALKRSEKGYAECIAEIGSGYCKHYESTINLLKDGLKRSKASLKKYGIARYQPILAKYENWNGTGNEVLSLTIYYTPIFEDINKKKTILQEESVKCANKSMDFSSLGITGGNEGLSSLERKICNKYAKF